MKSVVSLANLAVQDRPRRLEAAADGILGDLKERFPETQGFACKIEERLAKWAWPSRTKMSEQELLRSIDAETRKCAFRRGIRVTKGLRWGLTMDVQSTDREMSGVQLDVLRESPLSVIIAVSGFIAGILASVGYGFLINAFKDDYRDLAIAVFIGCAIGAGLALLGWVVSRPLEGLKADQAREIFESAVQGMTRAVRRAA
jgi:hypothetical protein